MSTFNFFHAQIFHWEAIDAFHGQLMLGHALLYVEVSGFRIEAALKSALDGF